MARRQVALGRFQTRVAVHRGITVRHLPVQLVGDARRSIMLPFNMGGHHDLQSVFAYVESLTDKEVVVALVSLVADFRNRHSRFEDRLEERYESAARITLGKPSGPRTQLAVSTPPINAPMMPSNTTSLPVR